MKLTDAELQMAARWADAFDYTTFSFTYGGQRSAELLASWGCERSVAEADDRQTHNVIYSDPVTGLQARVEVAAFRDFPAVEWVVYLKNTGTDDTPVIEDIQPLDAVLRSPGGNPVLHYAKGAVCSIDDFKPLTRVLNRGANERILAGSGRSSSDYLPFFNILSLTPDPSTTKRGGCGGGIILAIGWTGEWAAQFIRDDSDGLRIRAGMDLTHLKLHPGEEIRSPRILTLFWQGPVGHVGSGFQIPNQRGENQRGANMLRQFILAHHRPQAGGHPLDMPIFYGAWGGTPASDHLRIIEAIAQRDLPVEFYWIDAEWFGDGQWWTNAGNWNLKRDLYPEGFAPISDALHKTGRKLLLWFEPERVCAGTPWHEELREWLLDVPEDRRRYNWGAPQADPRWVEWESRRNQIVDGDMLIDLGNPEARRFLTDFISSKIDEFGLDCYRHDANIAPLEFWRAADAPDRQGITEIRWVEGLYEFWGELLRRHPGLIIDNCASGGRRIDIETLSLSTPFWRTDHPNTQTAKQCHTFGLLSWVPLNATGDLNLWKDGDYELRSTMSSSLQFVLFEMKDYRLEHIQPDYPWDKVKRMLGQCREMQQYFLGDYYPLTEYSQAEDAWMAYQLDLPEDGEGLVVVLKRPLSSLTAGAFPLKALNREADYEVSDLDKDQTVMVSGASLVDQGLGIELCDRPASALFTYRRVS